MIILFIIFLLFFSNLAHYYKKKKINDKIEIINNNYTMVFDNILSIINNNNIDTLNFINLTNNDIITNYALSYGFNIINEISDNTIIFINNYHEILSNYNNLIIISLDKIDNNKINFLINNKYNINFSCQY